MKKFILLIFVCCASAVSAQTEIARPNMDLGHWVTTSDQSDVIDRAVAAVPEMARNMVREMMEQRMPVSSSSEVCITEDILSNFDKKIEEVLDEKLSCTFDVIESTGELLVATATCHGALLEITSKVVSPKLNEARVVSNFMGMGETQITAVSEWQSADCPAWL